MTKKDFTIAINGSMLDEQPSGVGVYSFNVINNLSNLYAATKIPGLTVFSPTRTSLHKNLNIIKLSTFLQSSKYGKLAAFCRFFWNTFIYPIQARRFNLQFSPTTHGSFVLKNQVLTIHDLLSLRYNNISPHQRVYFKYLLPFLVARAKLVIAVSETTKKDIIHFLNCPPEKISVIYNGYDHLRYFASSAPSVAILENYNVQSYLLAVGPTYPHKNFERLLDGYNALPEKIKMQHPLVIAGGKKNYEKLLKKRVSDLGLEKQVHFLGYVPIELMAPLYREATALIFPSLYEGFGIPLLEAMACGCPVLSSDTSSMPEVCGDAALYFNPLDTLGITTAIKALVENESIQSELKRKGLEQCAKFSWLRTAESLKTLIESNFHLLKA